MAPYLPSSTLRLATQYDGYKKVSTILDTLKKSAYPINIMAENVDTILEKIVSEQRDAPIGIRREVLTDPTRKIHFSKDLVIAVQGVRRCGKSTLLRQIAQQEKIEGKSIFINFEDPRLGGHLNHELLESIVEFQESRSKDNLFFFFDEIQSVSNWERWLHIQLENQRRHFVITGSNSTLLSGKLGTALTGRHITIELFPFSFQEFLKIIPGGTFEEYLERGGFPRPLTYPEPEVLLREYFTDIIERDVRRHIQARSTMLLTQTARAVYETLASETSYRSLAKTFDSTPDTIKTYIDAFVAAYFCLECPFFTYSERKSVVRQKKYYPIDLGLRNAVTTNTGLNLGKKLETVVFHALIKKFRKVAYWRGKGEVDFVVETRSGVVPIQVSWEGPKERHYEALKEFRNEYPRSLDPVFIDHANWENQLRLLG